MVIVERRAGRGVFVFSARDVAPWREVVDDLAKSKADAELREHFISMLGHDLRNPLAGASCAVEYLQRENLSERGEIILKTAGQSQRRMFKLIGDVLDFVRAQMGGEIGILAKPEAALKPVVQKTVAKKKLANPDTQWKDICGFVDPVVYDPDCVAQLLSNLLGNAIFHGDLDGSIRVHDRDAGANQMISVTNTGGKISDKVRELLFEPFKRAEPGSSQNGLGLQISKQIAKSHNGGTEVESDGDKTAITLKIPRGRGLPKAVPNDLNQRRTAQTQTPRTLRQGRCKTIKS